MEKYAQAAWEERVRLSEALETSLGRAKFFGEFRTAWTQKRCAGRTMCAPPERAEQPPSSSKASAFPKNAKRVQIHVTAQLAQDTQAKDIQTKQAEGRFLERDRDSGRDVK